MAALCLDASLETLRRLCCHHTHCLQGDLCRCLHVGSLQALQVVVILSASHSFKTAHSLRPRGLRSGLLEGQFSALRKARRFLRSHSSVVLALWAVAESCWKNHSWPLKRLMLRGFTNPCSMSSWYTQAPVSPLWYVIFLAKMKGCHPLMWPPTKPWRRKGDGLPTSSELTSRDFWA